MKINQKSEIQSRSVGIVGCGFVGGALRRWVEEHNSDVRLLVSDPAKGFNDDVRQADIVFVCIHIPTQDDGTQDLSPIEEIVTALPDIPVFVRTTLLPGSSERLSKATGHRVHFMPEFLTERTAYEDFCAQPMVFSGEVEILKRIFVGKLFVEMTSLEAEITKYAHNVFGALKVSYFNGVDELCKVRGADYQKVRQGVLLSGYINPTHTSVPGPDGKRGYGGKCFPKDVDAFTKLCEGLAFHEVLAPIAKVNRKYRDTEK